MKHRIVLVLALLATAAAGAPAVAGDVNLNFYPISPRYLDEDFWDPIDGQVAFGGTVDFGRTGSPLHFAIGLISSAGDEDISNPFLSSARATISELSFGMTKVWETKGRTRPFLSGGLSFVQVDAEAETVFGDAEDDDDSIGVWIEGGVYWRLSAHFNLGLHGRILEGSDITLFEVDGDADYWQVGPMIGWSWPPRK